MDCRLATVAFGVSASIVDIISTYIALQHPQFVESNPLTIQYGIWPEVLIVCTTLFAALTLHKYIDDRFDSKLKYFPLIASCVVLSVFLLAGINNMILITEELM